MKIQDQVCTLEQAKRLRELGVRQESLFYHTHSEKWGVMPRKSIDFSGNPSSAFTVAELGVMLGTEEWSTNYKKQNIFYWDAELFALPFGAYQTEAEARAAMLIHQLENKLITPEQVNARLCDQP